MEHSPYSQSPSPSSSLVNFPTPTNLPDIRLHRPFSQMHDLKHLHIPFNMRFMENYSALPAHLLHHLQPPFLHPALDPRLSFSPAGVFQPLGSPSPHHQHPHHQHHSHHVAAAAAASLKGFTSAFAPPSKCYKMDDKQTSHAEGAAQQQQQQHHHHQQQQQQQQQQHQQQPVPPSFPYPPRRSPCSPGNMPVSPPSSNAVATMHQQHKDECSDRDTPSSGAISEDGRMIRRKKLSPPMSTAGTPTPAANGGASSTAVSGATAAAAVANNNNNHSNNNNNGSSIKQQQQQQQPPAGGGGQQMQQMPGAAAGCCPVCGTALRTAHELESHFIWELERLYKQAAAAGRRHRGGGAADKLQGDGHHVHGGLMACSRDGGRLSPVAGGSSSSSSRDATLHGRWETYQKVKANRHNRLRIKNRKRKPDEMLLTPTPATCCCPVCNEPVAAATQEQMNAHVEMCLRNKGHPAVATAGNDDEDENVDVEGDAETTMYDIVYGGGNGGWHGQQSHNRMRQQPMLMHGGAYNRGAASVPINCSGPGNPAQQPPPRQSATGGEDSAGGAEDAVLVVDDNDNENGGSGSGSIYNKYGPNQYAERDVIVPSRPPTASSESRRLSPAELNDPNAMEAMDSCENVGPLDVSIKKENTQDEGTVKPKMDVDKYCAQFNNNGQVVEALKARIRELESSSKTGSDKFTCLLCKGNFKDPVVSTSCWHVYCEVCWLQILGAKKLCPQCYVITLPSNLRRVYL